MFKTESDKPASPPLSNPPFTLQRQHTMGEVEFKEDLLQQQQQPFKMTEKSKTEDEKLVANSSMKKNDKVRQSPPLTKEECAFEEGIKRMKSSERSAEDEEEDEEDDDGANSESKSGRGPILLQRQWTFSHDIPDNNKEEAKKLNIKTGPTTPEPPPLLRLNSLSDDDCLGKTPRGFFGNEGDVRNLQGLESIKMEHLFSPPSIPPETPGNLILQRQDSWADDVSDSSWRAW